MYPLLFLPIPFSMLFLNDINDLKMHKKSLSLCFPFGVLLLVILTVMEFDAGRAAASTPLKGIFWALCAIFAVLTVYSLFFALPRKEAYTLPGRKRPAQTTGVYALCRHPGVLWFIPLYICLCPAAGVRPIFASAAIALNVLLALFEDRLIFPELLMGYAEYRSKTPFLFPRPESIRICISDLK